MVLKRLIKRNINQKETTKKLIEIKLDDFQLYDDKEQLEILLTKKANNENLTQEELKRIEILNVTGFAEIRVKEFNNILKALEKFNQNDYKQISQHTNIEADVLK